MAYKKFIRKNGKLYGPYTYHSRRVNGKVVSEYHGRKGFDYKKYFLFAFGAIMLAVIVYFVFNLNFNSTGNVALDLEGNYIENSPLEGFLKISLRDGELLPSNSKLVVISPEEEYEYELNSFVLGDAEQGNFYIEGTNISGSGLGFGNKGEKLTYPEVSFTLEIFSDSSYSSDSQTVSSGNSENNDTLINSNSSSSGEVTLNDSSQTLSETNISREDFSENILIGENDSSESIFENNVPVEEPTSEVLDSDSEESIEEVKSVETSSDSSQEDINSEESTEEEILDTENVNSQAPITGNVVSEQNSIFSKIFGFVANLFNPTGKVISETLIEVDGSVSGGDTFSYGLSEGQSARLKSGSVKYENETISDSLIAVSIEGGNAIVSSSFSQSEEGFGEEYLGQDETELLVNLNSLNLSSKNGSWSFKVVYDNQEIISTILNFSFSNQSFSSNSSTSLNITQGLNQTELNLTLNVTSNFTSINLSLTNAERQLLLNKFGNQTVKVEKAQELNDRILVRFSIGDYWIESTYDSGLSDSSLEILMLNDRIKWLKDLARSLSPETPETEIRNDLIQNYSI